MYVCLCKGITDNQIKDAINHGACSMRDLRSDLDVATQCGKCARDCKSILLENMTSNQSAAIANAQFIAA
ncbi:MAG TPA: (2Fe-2S)-binding protein [Pseudomonas sabulinigri]|uniref:Bacterioferritin-associated ferredoxin n=1 Tax=marine sediment metagenome TaxID=412755 RepID=A0A0F9TB16_9ZZZZ|nr:(2Fe-2S)-binding protein [Halopseudomonas sabulinigri]HEC51538.1 (2Fe-2S)-binding protein [Halopseudomonas sabulinigri]